MKLITELNADKAQALSQFCKRITYTDVQKLAVDEAEADLMFMAIYRVKAGLADAGFDPR